MTTTNPLTLHANHYDLQRNELGHYTLRNMQSGRSGYFQTQEDVEAIEDILEHTPEAMLDERLSDYEEILR